MVWHDFFENFKFDHNLYIVCGHILIIICMGARAAKGEGLKILWHRPSRVRIPSHALLNFLISDIALVAQPVERYLGKVEVGGSNPP